MPKLTITLDKRLKACLEELADFEGENIKENIRIGIRGHYLSFLLFKQEALEMQHNQSQQPEEDDLIPL